MFYNLLLALLIIDGLILCAAVLLQAGQGGGLASLGGGTTDMVLGGRQAVTILHKTSWITGALFMVLPSCSRSRPPAVRWVNPRYSGGSVSRPPPSSRFRLRRSRPRPRRRRFREPRDRPALRLLRRRPRPRRPARERAFSRAGRSVSRSPRFCIAGGRGRLPGNCSPAD